MGVQIPKIIKAINKENNLLDKILKKEKYDIIISDNRYGLYTEKAICIFITHQLNINAGIFENLVNKIQHSYIKRFNYCWVPDYETESQSLAGALSKKNKYFKNVLYIGPQSIFKKTEQHSPAFDLCFLLSGPEPQRSRLERNIFEWCSNTKKKICIVRGTDIPLNIKYEDNIIVYNLVEPSLINQLFYNCKMIVCRSGYSTIMDLHHIGKTAIFIPTPGQTEQEYLAKYHELKHKAKIIKQKELVEKLEELLN